MIPEIEELKEYIVNRPFTTTHFQHWEKRHYKQDSPNSFGIPLDFIHYFNIQSGHEFQLGFQYGKPFPLFLVKGIETDLWDPFEHQLSKLKWESKFSMLSYADNVAVCNHP